MEIPIVDFSKCSIAGPDNTCEEDVDVLGKQIYEAFSTVGFVYLKNTGITSEEVDKVTLVTKKFFELGVEVKNQFARDGNNYGYAGLNVERVNPERPGDFKETFNVSGAAFENDGTLWPDQYVPEFSSVLRQFSRICKRLSILLLHVLAAGMKIKDKDYFMRCHSRLNGADNYTTLRSLYYPPIADDVEIKPGQIRLGEHCDYGSFTLLFQDQVGGLQIESHEGEYIDAPPIPDTILVNIGDALQFWTKGRLKSTRHRVLIPQEDSKRRMSRRSIGYFIHPDHEVMMSEMEYGAACPANRGNVKPEYDTPISAFEHVNRRFQKSYI